MYRFELVRKEVSAEEIKVKDFSDVSAFFRKTMGEKIKVKQMCYIACLNSQNEIIGVNKLSEGGHTVTYIDVKIVSKIALDSLATGVILVKNNPTGNVNSSDDDKKTAQSINKALGLFGIKFLDFVIVNDKNDASILEECGL